MILKTGDGLIIAHRRLYEKDETRFFIGRVDEYEAGIVKLTGHSYVQDRLNGTMVGKTDVRTKIISLASGTLLVHLLPDDLDLDKVEFKVFETQLLLTSDSGFTMNLTEHPHRGQL